ncbi:MAG: hypothetical protein HY296_01275 [Thaumarchaeota archaeon]|nr:hypothetical protein [Nitrososphaerota archaeon]
MRVVTRIDSLTLSGKAQAAFDNLGFSYRKNQGGFVTEFEVLRPCQFRVTVEDQTRPRLSFLIRSPFRVESAIETMPVVGAKGAESELKEALAKFVDALLGQLSETNSEGRTVNSKEKANLERLVEL